MKIGIALAAVTFSSMAFSEIPSEWKLWMHSFELNNLKFEATAIYEPELATYSRVIVFCDDAMSHTGIYEESNERGKTRLSIDGHEIEYVGTPLIIYDKSAEEKIKVVYLNINDQLSISDVEMRQKIEKITSNYLTNKASNQAVPLGKQE